jgi:2-dehydropantoate 2-reductase
MLQDIEQGRPIEIQALVGPVVELDEMMTTTPAPNIAAVCARAGLLAKTLNLRHGKLEIVSGHESTGVPQPQHR